MEQEEFGDFPEDILAKAKKATEDLLPKKSRASYDKEFKIFVNWKLKNALTVVNEAVMMAYFQELSEKYSANSLWTKYSFLKSTLIVNNNVDIFSLQSFGVIFEAKIERLHSKKVESVDRSFDVCEGCSK